MKGRQKLTPLNTDAVQLKGRVPSELKLVLDCGRLSSEYRLIFYT
jgi:hypothetical protein